jgi:dihydroorotate dehydrogenase electron transfer subunit
MLTLDPRGLRPDPLLPRPMAVYRGEGERLEFRFRPVGRGTRLLGELPEGAPIGVVGPLGNGFQEPESRPILVGGGTGIASLYEFAATCGDGVTILLGGRTADEILGLADFQALQATLTVTTEDGSLGHRGLVTDLLKPAPGDEVYTCGPNAMMRRVHELAQDAGVRCWASLEAHMACGFGVCLGCAIKTHGGFRYVCSDGPVFDTNEIVWDELP